MAKSIDRDIFVVVGGPHASLAGADVLKEPAIDLAVRGEGEETLVEILRSVESGQDVSSIPGVIYRRAGSTTTNPARAYLHDLDSLAFPVSTARTSLIDYDKYPPEALRYMFAVRGCPYACTFCGSRYIWGRNVRFRSPQNIVAEMREIQKARVDYIRFDDDTFGVTKPFIRKLCAEIKARGAGLSWACETHVQLIDEETVALMKSAGCRSIHLGVESGNNEMLRRIRKNITVEEAFTAARIIKKHKVSLHAFFMVGFPHETEESLTDTIGAIQSLPCDVVTYSIFTPYFGTELFEWCRQQGIISDDFNVFLHNHQTPDNYFCPGIPEEVFKRRVRELERTIDRINGRRRLWMYLSREGFLRLKGKGVRRALSRVLHLCRQATH